MDDDLWHEISKDIKPLTDKRERAIERTFIDIEITRPPRKAGDKNSSSIAQGVKLPDLVKDDLKGVDKSVAKKLKSGKFEMEAKLDLHGFTQSLAYEALYGFINNARLAGKRVVLVVTGKGVEGKGVLYNEVPKWLNAEGIRENILAFCSANRQHGGDGALYVVLRK